jgi:hypothetical protein
VHALGSETSWQRNIEQALRMSLNEIFGPTSRSNSYERTTGLAGSSLQLVLAKAQWLGGALGPVGLASIVAGFALACFGAIFAVQQGVSFALALMAAYCVVTTCIACTVTLTMLAQRTPKTTVVRPVESRPSGGVNIAAWRLVSELRVSDACRLWCDIEPGSAYSQEAIAWATAMLDAIKKGDLPILQRTDVAKEGARELDERERSNPTWRTRVSRDALKSWAASHGYCPAFLDN